MNGLLLKFVAGLFIGLSNVIPGVSGGTIAVIFRVYPLLLIISSLDLNGIKANKKDIFAMLAGIALGIVVFARIVSFFYGRFPIYTSYFFVGIVLGSIPFVYAMSRLPQKVQSPLVLRVVAFVLGSAVMIALFFAQRNLGEGGSILQVNLSLPMTAVWLFCSGLVAAMAMIIPGISGSLILLLMGAYPVVIQAVSDMNVLVLMPAALGILVGLVLGSKLVRKCLELYPQVMYSAILALVIASVPTVVPLERLSPIGWVIAIVTLVAGIAVVFVFSRISTTRVEVREEVANHSGESRQNEDLGAL